jgi:type I restriction enzyme S subunit
MLGDRWESVPARRLLVRQSRPVPDGAETVTAFRDGEVVARSKRRIEGFTESTMDSGYQGVEVGDLVVHSMDGFAGAIGVSRSDGKMSPVVHIYRSNGLLDLRFAQYFLRHLASTGYVQALAKGIRERSTSFDPATLADLPIPVPPIEEQRRIADFLDDQLSLIHTVMEARNRQSALLRLELQTEISELVLGAESERVQLRRVIQRRADYGANAAAEFEEREWPRFIRTTDIAADGGLREETFRSLPPEVAEDYLLEDGDVLFTRSGSVGKSFIYRRAWGPAAFAGYLIRVSTDRSRLLPEWLKAFAETDSYWAQIRESAVQSTIPNVNAERYSGLMLPVPPLMEQVKRMVHIQRVQELAQARNDVLSRSGRLMEELRVAMITAAVTGELDVTTARRGIPA